MAASSDKRMKDLLTDEDISRVLDTKDERDVLSEESDDFRFDTSEEDSDRDSNTSSTVDESVLYEEVSRFFATFCTPQRGASRICISQCKWSECAL